jgi:hypothetical protein
VDDPGRGYQTMPAVAARAGVVSVLWYDSRHDAGFAPLELIHGLDVYYAALDAGLARIGLLRPTLQTQRADQPVFRRARPAAAARAELLPHDWASASSRASVAGAAPEAAARTRTASSDRLTAVALDPTAPPR